MLHLLWARPGLCQYLFPLEGDPCCLVKLCLVAALTTPCIQAPKGFGASQSATDRPASKDCSKAGCNTHNSVTA